MSTNHLSRPRIIAAALNLIDREGVAGLSMRRLGAELGVDPKAVYYYLPNKAALFDGVVEALYAEMRLEELSPKHGTELLTEFASRMRAALQAHPRAVVIFATNPGQLEVYGSGAEATLARLRGDGFTPRTALTMISCLRALVVGLVITEAVESDATDGGSEVSEEPVAMTRYPTLGEAVAGGFDADEQFHAGLEAILTGFGSMARETPRNRVALHGNHSPT